VSESLLRACVVGASVGRRSALAGGCDAAAVVGHVSTLSTTVDRQLCVELTVHGRNWISGSSEIVTEAGRLASLMPFAADSVDAYFF